MSKTINTDTDLSFAAIGLWHKALAHYGRTLDGSDLLTLHPDPNAWGPFNETHDMSGPFDELQALGYVQTEDGGNTYTLHFCMDEEAGCWECLGYVRAGTYCGNCGLINEEGDDGAETRERPS